MKLDLDTSKLDWSKATCRDYRYIHHLMLMINDRYQKLGISSSGLPVNMQVCRLETGSPVSFNMFRYAPGGILTWQQLSMIYHAVFYLATYVFINDQNFKQKNWKNGDNRVFFGFTPEQICKIAEFDFFAKPFIPGQVLNYYDQFLYPLKKVLTKLRYVMTTHFEVMPYVKKNPTTYTNDAEKVFGPIFCGPTRDPQQDDVLCPVPKKQITDQNGDKYQYRYQGKDFIDYFKNPKLYLDKFKQYYGQCKTAGYTPEKPYYQLILGSYSGSYQSYHTNPGILGYEYGIGTRYEVDRNYDQSQYYNLTEDLCIQYISVNYGNYFRCASPIPSGTPYTLYLLHTTGGTTMIDSESTGGYIANDSNLVLNSYRRNCSYPAKYNSPWEMVIKKQTGTISTSGVFQKWIQLPDWNIPVEKSFAQCTKGKKYSIKYKLTEDKKSYTTQRPPWYGNLYRCFDSFAAHYYPALVLDFNNKFEYY